MAASKYVFGVDIGGTNLRVALADAAGTILARTLSTTTDVRDPQLIVEKIRQSADQLLRDTGVQAETIAAIGVGAPGVTNAETGVVIATSYLLGWRDVPLKAMLEEALHLPAAVDNDVNLAALGESFFGTAMGAPNFVFLAVGTGVGAGIILKGELFQGAEWSAGEVGYMLVPGVPELPAEVGKPGALESMVGGEGLRQQWLSMWNPEHTNLPKNLTATQIFDNAVAGDALANALLDQAANTLACAIFNIALILNTPLFVLGGSVGLHSALCDRTQNIVDAHARGFRPQVVLSSLGSDAQLMGAIRLAQLTAAR
ncbi:MAG: ROK family protein [Candidatus Sulfotelmatobacter sp.]